MSQDVTSDRDWDIFEKISGRVCVDDDAGDPDFGRPGDADGKRLRDK